MKSDDYYDEYEDESDRRWIKRAAIGILVVALGAGAFVLFTGDDGQEPQLGAGNTATEDTEAAPNSAAATSTAPSTAATDETDATETTGATDTTDATESTDSNATASSTASTAGATATSSENPAGSTTSVGQEAPVAPGEAGTTTIPAGIDPTVGYPTNPDGSPLPVVAIFDTETVTLTGFVPSQAAKDRLAVLAAANSLSGAEVVNNLLVNDRVPANVGVRVIELNSPRFPTASAEILPEHALQLDRVANVMNLLPNSTVLVVGHADQRGTDANNFAISDARADAVVNYLVFVGISPTRLSSRAAGDSDLLTAAEDETGLALNRRTEFVFYGLLVE